ncbi:hypothetical protein ElyMa_005081900 [Elysia marginata]|uniref:Uncharacterized protein n=1 Tax=Elysia marginata TaxID=1093978 RepID=A0AAV4JI63_9GAST|nr:hypothetical protein ElyMa_005081900 [Elysia marginata]
MGLSVMMPKLMCQILELECVRENDSNSLISTSWLVLKQSYGDWLYRRGLSHIRCTIQRFTSSQSEAGIRLGRLCGQSVAKGYDTLALTTRKEGHRWYRRQQPPVSTVGLA